MSTTAAIFPMPSLDHNLPCLHCGYNLRTLSTDARCPECSAPIAASLNPALLRYEDPSWTSTLSLSMGLLLLATSLELLYIIASLLDPNSDTLQSVAEFAQPLHAFASPLTWLAVILLGKPNPRPLSLLSRNKLRRTLRVMAVIGFVSALYADLAGTTLAQLFPDIIDLPIQQFIELLGTIVLYLYLLHLARRTGLPKLLRHTRIAMAATTFALCIWTTLDIFSDHKWAQSIDLPARLALMPIFLYQLYLLFLFHRTLRKCATFARQYWNFCSPIPQPNRIT
jgi:hypothetical protein